MPTIQTAWQSVISIQAHQAAEAALNLFQSGDFHSFLISAFDSTLINS